MKHDLYVNTESYEIECTVDYDGLVGIIRDLEDKETTWLVFKDVFGGTYRIEKTKIEYVYYN